MCVECRHIVNTVWTGRIAGSPALILWMIFSGSPIWLYPSYICPERKSLELVDKVMAANAVILWRCWQSPQLWRHVISVNGTGFVR